MRVCVRERECGSEGEWETVSVRALEGDPQPFCSSFYVFFLPLCLPNVNWPSHECCLFYLRFSLRSSDFPLFYFRQLFPSWSFSQWHSGLLFPISNYLTILINVLFLPDFFLNLSYLTNGNEDDNDDDDELIFI